MAWDPAPGSHPDWAGERQERGGMDWGYLLVFVVIPMAIAWWLTNRTAQQVNRMWAADHPAEPAVTDKVHSPTDRESDPPAEATIRAHIRTEENRALGLLAQAGHPDTWDVDPQFKTELISHMQQVSPSLYQQWLAQLAATDPDGWPPRGSGSSS